MPLNNHSITAKRPVFACPTLLSPQYPAIGNFMRTLQAAVRRSFGCTTPGSSFSVAISFLFILFLGLFFPMKGEAQCIGFAKNIARPLLEDFVHDGNYSATILGEGESAELYKTFFEGLEYRLVVATVNTLPQIRIIVMDMHKMVLFDNAQHNFSQKWDFYMETTQKLIVKVKVLENDDPETNIGGCVAILFGVK
jgi:hypothetical protein